MKSRNKLHSYKKHKLRFPKGNLSHTTSLRDKSQMGLTFIEILLATVMIALISIALYGMLSNGIKVWQKVNEETPQIDMNLFFERLELELKNCVYFKNMEFIGEQHRFNFPALVIGANMDSGFPESMGKVDYFYNREQNTLNRNYVNYQNSSSMQIPAARSLVNNVKESNFSYYFFSNEKQQFFWSDIWPPDTKEKISKYPQAVRITLVLDLGKTIQKRTKTINIPVGGIVF